MSAESSSYDFRDDLNLLLHEGPFGVASLHLDFRFQRVNPQLATMLGYSHTELEAKTLLDLLGAEDQRQVERRMALLRTEGGSYQPIEACLLGRNGDSIWTNLYLTLTRSEAGEPQRYLLMAENIAQRKQDEQEIKRLNQRLERRVAELDALLNVLPIGIGIAKDPACRDIRINPAFARLLNVSSDRNVSLSAPEDERPSHFKVLHQGRELTPEELPIQRAAALGAEISEFEEEVVWDNGVTFSLLGYAAPLFNADGSVRGSVGGFVDITKRKEAEMALRESEARFRTLVDELPLHVWMLGSQGEIIFVNRSWQEFTGFSEAEARRDPHIERLHPEDRDAFLGKIQEAMTERKNLSIEFRTARYDGQYRNLLSIAMPRFYEDGSFQGYLGASMDITDQKILQEQLTEAQKLESLGRLAGGVAHDFNNLLTAIMGYTELASLSLPEEAKERPWLDNIQTAAERAANLTKQLLMYARKQMVEFSVIDINRVILGMDSLLRRTIGEQYELVTILAEETCAVHSNVSQIEQVLLNLVLNARDAMEEGGRILIETVCVTLDDDYASRHAGVAPGAYVLFTVSDTGTGMTSEVRERIFEPFFTTKEVGKGTGLGLATCYGIVKQSKGNIWVYSEPGRGTTFKVYLPRVASAIQKQDVTEPDPLPAGTETILIVDDEPMVRDTAARILRAHGYRVLEASNGVEALHVQSGWSGSIDLLLTDVVMPLMGGKELAQRLQEGQPNLAVLYMSGYTQNTILDEGVLKPGMELLTKPFTAATLVQKVRDVLSVRS